MPNKIIEAMRAIREANDQPPAHWEQFSQEAIARIARHMIRSGHSVSDVTSHFEMSQGRLLKLLVASFGIEWQGKVAEVTKQTLHHNADISYYTFYHISGQVFHGTRTAFCEKFSVPAANVTGLLGELPSGQRLRSPRRIVSSAYNWFLYPITSQELHLKKKRHAAKGGAGNRGKARDKRLHHFYNHDLELSVLATQLGMQNLGYLNRVEVCELLTKKTAYVRKGFCLAKNADHAYERSAQVGQFAGHTDRTIRIWINTLTGEQRKATTLQMKTEFGSACFEDVARERRRSSLGWIIGGQKIGKEEPLLAIDIMVSK